MQISTMITMRNAAQMRPERGVLNGGNPLLNWIPAAMIKTDRTATRTPIGLPSFDVVWIQRLHVYDRHGLLERDQVRIMVNGIPVMLRKDGDPVDIYPE